MNLDMSGLAATMKVIAGSAVGWEMAARLGQSLEITDALWELVPVVVAAGERVDERPGALVGDSGLLAALTGWGMAHVQPHSPADPAWIRPATPDLALQGVLAGHQNRLARDQEQLLDGHRRLAEAQARFGIGMNGRFPAHLVTVVSDRAEISDLSASLMNTARKDWMSLENLDTEMPLTDDFAQPPLPAFAGRVRCRSIYAAPAMDDPVGRRIIEACAEGGEQARLLAEVPMKMKLADHTTAMLPLTPAGTAGALVVRAPVIIAALRDYFELLWDRATPVGPSRPGRSKNGPPGNGLTATQQTVLRLMAEGHQDDAIATRAGISTTSVRRHIKAIMNKLGVDSRFAAGAAAQRRGWIG